MTPTFRIPTIHFKDGAALDAVCNPYVRVVAVFDHKQVTCGNCKRTWLFKQEADRRHE